MNLIDLVNLDISDISVNHIMLFCSFGAGMFVSATEFYSLLYDLFELVGPLVDGDNLGMPLSFEYILMYSKAGMRSIAVILFNYDNFMNDPLGWRFIPWDEMRFMNGWVFYKEDPYIEAHWYTSAVLKEEGASQLFKFSLDYWIQAELSTCIQPEDTVEVIET